MAIIKLLAIILSLAALLPAAASADNKGLWAVGCGLVGSGQYDAIRAPGQPGNSHLHDFFGYRDFTSAISAPQLKDSFADPSSNSCLLKADSSAYWVPALYQQGIKADPTAAWAYYLRPAGAKQIKPYPLGMQIIAGNASASKPQYSVVRWYCDWDSTFDGPPQSPPDCGGIQPVDQPDGSSLQDQLRLELTFPDCWNGKKALGSVRYDKQGVCPSRYKLRLPQLKLNVLYPVRYPGKNLSLASGSILTAHADFVNGWRPAEQQALISGCLAADVSCGRLRDRTQQQAWKLSPPIAAEQIRSLLQAGI